MGHACEQDCDRPIRLTQSSIQIQTDFTENCIRLKWDYDYNNQGNRKKEITLLQLYTRLVISLRFYQTFDRDRIEIFVKLLYAYIARLRKVSSCDVVGDLG